MDENQAAYIDHLTGANEPAAEVEHTQNTPVANPAETLPNFNAMTEEANLGTIINFSHAQRNARLQYLLHEQQIEQEAA